MKLSEKTIAILKNFSSINSGIAFKAGNKISTVSPQKNYFKPTLLLMRQFLEIFASMI